MYKELKESIKEFNPGEDSLKEILSRIKIESLVHRGENCSGEIYENWSYEFLKAWAVQCDNVSFFLIKSRDEDRPVSGLSYDKNGQIIYLKNGRKVAEFDGIFRYKDSVVFIEASISDLRSYYRKLEDRLIVKRELLKELFNCEVYYLLVTRPKKRTIPYRSLPHLVLYKLKNPDFSLLDNEIQASEIVSPKLIGIKSFISSFS